MPSSVENALTSPKKAILYSLSFDGHDWKGADSFHGWRVLGKVILTGEKAVQVANEFKQAVQRAKNYPASCFNPRHGLEVTDKGHTFDAVLCYECGEMEVYEDNKPLTTLYAAGSPSFLNDVLVKEHIPLSK